MTDKIQFSSVQDGIYALGKAHDYVLHPVSQIFPTVAFEIVPMFVLLTMGWPSLVLSMISSNTSASHASLLKAIHTVKMSWLCARGQYLLFFNTSDLPRRKPFLTVGFPTRLAARSFALIPPCPRQYIHKSFRKWMPHIDTCYSWLSVPLSTFL